MAWEQGDYGYLICRGAAEVDLFVFGTESLDMVSAGSRVTRIVSTARLLKAGQIATKLKVTQAQDASDLLARRGAFDSTLMDTSHASRIKDLWSGARSTEDAGLASELRPAAAAVENGYTLKRNWLRWTPGKSDVIDLRLGAPGTNDIAHFTIKGQTSWLPKDRGGVESGITAAFEAEEQPIVVVVVR